MKNNALTLIGMAGVGKSSIGKSLAKKLHWTLIDTDTELVNQFKISIQDYIQKYGEPTYLNAEEDVILNIPVQSQLIIATGGSAIYSEKSLAYLKTFSTLIYLQDDLKNIQERIKDFSLRGMIKKNTTSLKELYSMRKPLYEKAADITISVNPFHKSKITDTIIHTLNLL